MKRRVVLCVMGIIAADSNLLAQRPLVPAGDLAAPRSPQDGSAVFPLEWRSVADLPDPVGLKGMYAGTNAGRIVLAGGSNFPVAQRASGRKTFHRTIYVRDLTADFAAPWTKASGGLPIACGEGASVTTAEGMVWLGGHDGNSPLAAVWLVRWNPTTNRVEFTSLPDLPEPVTNASAAWIDGWIYVAGGEGRDGVRRSFWRMEVGRAIDNPSQGRWEVLPHGPGRPRTGGILVPVTTPAGRGLLWGGGVHAPAKSQADYLSDAHIYHPADGRWRPAARMPRGAVLAAVVQIDPARVLVLGGSDGHDFTRMKELGDRYRIPSDVLLYDARYDRWTSAGTMPLGTVAPAVVAVNDGWLIAGGEYSPGLRTAQAFHLRMHPSPAPQR